MPFGRNCEFQDFDACVRAMKRDGNDDEAARRICGALQRDTKEQCMSKAYKPSEITKAELAQALTDRQLNQALAEVPGDSDAAPVLKAEAKRRTTKQDDPPMSPRGWTTLEIWERTDGGRVPLNQPDAGYTEPGPVPDVCAACRFFQRGAPGEAFGRCQVVTGPIAEWGFCELFISAAEAALFAYPSEEQEADMALSSLNVVKADSERRYTLTVAYPADETDTHGHTIASGELEKAAWSYMLQHRQVGLDHDDGTEGAGKIVESYIYRGPQWVVDTDASGQRQVINPGDWLVGIIWDEGVWEQVKSGEITGISLQGRAKLKPAT